MTERRLPTQREALGIPDNPTIYIALSFAKIAKRDLCASRILYQRKLYPQAIFSLQQAVEKAAKGVGLLLSLLRPTEEDLMRNVRHASIYAILVRRPERLAQLRRNLDVLVDTKGLEEAKAAFAKAGFPWTIPDQKEMRASLMDDKTAAAEVNQLRRLQSRDMWKATLELASGSPFYAAVMKLLKDAEAQWKSLDLFQSIFEEKLTPWLSAGATDTIRYTLNINGKAFPEVIPLAFLTMWHERETRYPPIDSSHYWSPEKYTADSGLVKLCPRLYRHAKRLCDGAETGAEAALKIK